MPFLFHLISSTTLKRPLCGNEARIHYVIAVEGIWIIAHIKTMVVKKNMKELANRKELNFQYESISELEFLRHT